MKIGFIGIGTIAGAIIQGLCTSEAEGLAIFVSPRNEKLSSSLAARYGNVSRLESNQEVVDRSDVVVIAVRPPVAREVLAALRFRADQTVVSLVALLPFAPLRELTRPAAVACRAIPLPTVTQHNCPIPLYHADERVTRLFGYLGETLPVSDEEGLHALWTLTGLITPYYDLMARLSEWTVAHGVRPETATAYVADLFQSLSFLAQRSEPIDFGELAKHAATPGGINEQAGAAIAAAGAHRAWEEAAGRVLMRFKA